MYTDQPWITVCLVGIIAGLVSVMASLGGWWANAPALTEFFGFLGIAFLISGVAGLAMCRLVEWLTGAL